MKHEKHSRFAYQAVYGYLLELIAQMAPGSYCKLPSLRDVAQRLNVSISTVQYAYSLLEHEGRVQSVPKSGYFACGPDTGIRTGAAGDLLHDLQHHANRPRMLVLSSGRGPTLPSLEATLLGMERQLLRQYPRPVANVHPCGELELRTVLAARYTRSAQLYWSAEDVYLAGDLRALVDMLVAALELRGCKVLVTTPCSWRLLRILQSAGLQVVELPLGDRGEVDLEQLAAVLSAESVRLVMLASHLNCPQGSVMSDEQRHGIARLLDHQGVWLLENDLDAEWCFERPRQCLRELVDPQRLLIMSSLERTVGAEAPYAYLLSRNCQAQLQREFLARGFRLPPLRQQAVARLYAKGRIDVHLEQLRLSLRESVACLHRQMQVQLGGQLKFQMPAGGATVWAQAQAPLDTRALFHRLLKQGLVIAPGELFSLQGHYRQHMRLGWPSRQQGDLQQGLSVLHEELRRAQKTSR